MIWVLEILPLETVILALMDNTDSPLGIPLIKYLLLSNDQFLRRVRIFTDANINSMVKCFYHHLIL